MPFSNVKNSGSDNYIPKGTEINGNLNTASNLRIEGKVVGKVVTSEKMISESSSMIVGDVDCKNAQIGGLIEGNIYATNILELHSGSKIIGNTVSAKIILEDNCQISGNMKLKK